MARLDRESANALRAVGKRLALDKDLIALRKIREAMGIDEIAYANHFLEPVEVVNFRRKA